MPSLKPTKSNYNEALNVMEGVYGQDTPMSLATANDGKPNIRVVDTYYKNGAFYVTTYALSQKMKEIAHNPYVALNHNLFVAHGLGENLGNPRDASNEALREELQQAFITFYDRHVDERDRHTCILKITLMDALLFADNYKYKIDFQNKTATKEKHIVDIAF